jgi:hypothetical protein
MFKKTVTFKDFNDETRTQDFYFHISKVELIALATGSDDMQERIKRIIASQDGAAILKELRDIIKLAVGIRSEDGQRFVKDEAAQSILLDSPAYDELLMELATDANKCSDFIAQLIPEKMQKEMQAQLQKNNPTAAAPEDTRPAYQREHREPTEAELDEMTRDELRALWIWRANKNKVL